MSTSSGTLPSTIQPRIETRRTISPYDLSSGDNPGFVISQPALKGSNYDEWSANLRLALKARKKFGFADGTISKPSEDSPDLEDWWTNNALVVSWIKLTIDPNVSSNLSHCDVAFDLWEQIKRRYSVKNGQRIQRLKTELATCRQKGLAIETYYGKLSKIWTNLQDFQCAKTMEEVAKEREEDKLHQFLMGLDETIYGLVKSNLLSRTPLPTLDEAYQVLIQDEESKAASRLLSDRMEEVSFAVHASPRSRASDEPRSSGRRVCSSCGKTGHLAEFCFRKLGYPAWWGDRPRSKSIGNTSQPRALLPSPGRGRGGNISRANQVTASPIGSVFANATITEADRVGITGLNDHQWQNLVQLLNERDQTHATKLSGKISISLWIIDTGASNHMTGSSTELDEIHNMSPVLIQLPDGRHTTATKYGTVQLGSQLSLQRVYLVDGLKCHLISVSQLNRDKACVFQITDKLCIIQDRITRTLIGAGEQVNGLYFLRSTESATAMHISNKTSSEIWHQRLGHLGSKVLGLLPISGFRRSSCDFDAKACDICIRAKQSRESFPLSLNKTTDVFELVHCDLWGPYRTPALCGSRYFLTILDDYSRALWIYLLPDKQQAPTNLKNFIALVKRQFNKHVKTIRSDNGSEFICLTKFFREKGIIHETSCVGTPQQNGRVERKHRHILNVARALRFQASLPLEFWGQCVLAASYLINRIPASPLDGKTPFEMLYRRPPPLHHLRVFGCLCYVHNQHHGGDKFSSRSNKSVFLGYPFGKKGWRVYNLETKRISVSRDVVFLEDQFPFSDYPEPAPGYPANPSTPQVGFDIFMDDSIESAEPVAPISDVVQSPRSEIPVPIPNDLSSIEPLGRGHRKRTQPPHLADYILHTVVASSSSHDSCSYPIDDYLSCTRFSESHRAYIHAITSAIEPQFYSQAVHDPNWQNAMRDEINALEDNETWTIETLPPGKKAIGCKWVYKYKYKSDGSLERHKARLVVLGNNQIEGEDFTDTFAPVAKMTTVRVFLEVSVALNWEIHQMDVHNAFLHGDLDEEVFMQLPPGFRTNDKTQVCRLHKSLYGLRQAPRCWFAKLTSALVEYGFTQSLSDYSLFTYSRGVARLHLLVYVDDLIISGSDLRLIQLFKDYLGSCFKMKDLGVLKYFLGIEVARSPSGIYLSQRKYVLDIISESGLLGAKPVTFPLDQNHRLALAEGDTIVDPSRYRRLVGRLIYLNVTRPELSYAIHVLTQFMKDPKQEHWDAALRVVRFLKGNPGQGILLRADSSLTLTAWCDSDWAGCPLTRRSLTGYFIQLGNSPISWKTKKQPTVSCSSAEAEYRALSYTVREIIWLKTLLLTLGVDQGAPVVLNCDSLAAIHIGANPVFHERTKHIEVDCHMVRNAILQGVIQTRHVSTQEQLADIFTKALGRKEFDAFILKLGIHDLHAPT